MPHNTCPECKRIGTYSEKFDAFVCTNCNSWLESECDDEGCAYCTGRPVSPKAAYLGKVKTYSDIDVLYSLEHFRSLVASGSIMTDDGNSAALS